MQKGELYGTFLQWLFTGLKDLVEYPVFLTGKPPTTK